MRVWSPTETLGWIARRLNLFLLNDTPMFSVKQTLNCYIPVTHFMAVSLHFSVSMVTFRLLRPYLLPFLPNPTWHVGFFLENTLHMFLPSTRPDSDVFPKNKRAAGTSAALQRLSRQQE